MQRILLLDNYDSFTFNLEHYLSSQDVIVDVLRNDEIIRDISVYDKIVLSPGPGIPEESRGMMDLLQRRETNTPVLGVCLGMQAIAMFLEGELYNQNQVKHGVEETIDLYNSRLFIGLERKIKVGLYHSWSVIEGKGDFEIISHSESGVIMGIQNEALNLYGVQFHPESVMTPFGKKIIQNFLNLN